MIVKPKLWTSGFVFLAIANLLMAIAFYFMLPVLPVYLKDILGASNAEIGLILSFYTIAALVIRLFSGWAIDVYGRKWIYLFAYALFAIIFIGYPLASSVIFFVIVRIAHGLSWGALTTSGSTIAVDLIPASRRGEGVGIFGLSMTIGMALGPLIAILIASNTNYNTLFLSAIGISFAGVALALLINYPKISLSAIKPNFSFRGLVERSSLPISLNMLVIMFTYGGVLSFIALYGKEIGVENSGVFFLILSIGIGLSRISSGRILDLRGPSSILLLGMILLVIGFPVLALFKNSLGFHLAAVILGLGFGIIMPTFQTMVNNLVPPNRRGAANSSFFTAFDLGIGLGMIGTGLLSERLGFGSTFLIFSVISLLALNIFLLITLKHYNSFRMNL